MRTEEEGLKNPALLPHPARDYRWLKLPKRAGAMDVDFLVERHGQFLAIEMKPPGVWPDTGVEIALQALAALPQFTVWLAQGPSITGTYDVRQARGTRDSYRLLFEGGTLEDLDVAANAWFLGASR